MESGHSSRNQQVLLDIISDGLFTVDAQCRITAFNQAAERITGVAREDAIGRLCQEVFRSEYCGEECILRSRFEAGDTEPAHIRLHAVFRDGRHAQLDVCAAAFSDENGAFAGGVIAFHEYMAHAPGRRRVRREAAAVHGIISKNTEMLRLLALLPDLARCGSTVVIEGPSGSGKELFARAIHNLSPRQSGRYVAVNCGALPDALLESELFGYKRGAFTDARQDKLGRFALAEGGTLFLDEVGELPRTLQVKLLRVLQEKEYEPVGGVETLRTDVRVIAATNRPLLELVEQGRFRSDLFYRLNVVRLALPPLSQRREDIPLLVEHFIEHFCKEKGKNIVGVNREALGLLVHHAFPGNVRELENAIEHAFVLCHGAEILPEHLPVELRGKITAPSADAPSSGRPLERSEAAAIEEALRRHEGNRAQTARALHIHNTTLWRKMRKYGIQ